MVSLATSIVNHSGRSLGKDPAVGSSAATFSFSETLAGSDTSDVLKVIVSVLTELQMKPSQCREAVGPV